MPWCNNCGAFVSGEFVRVFGSNDSQVYACLDCAVSPDLHAGEAANRP